MRKLAIAVALASTALASPAFARDHSPYVGIEAGGMIVEDQDFDYSDPTINNDDGVLDSGYIVNYKTGFDVDLIAGYDLGFVRLEGELAYKRASVDGINVDPLIAPAGDTSGNIDGGRVSVFSGMANVLLDFGNEDGLSGYIGGGAGFASVKLSAGTSTTGAHEISDSDSRPAFQGIAGVRYAVSQNIDIGLKYRFFTATNLKFSDDFGGTPFRLKGSYRSNSLLASLIYNFYAPPPPAPPPPPPPPPPPATQTCPDGSVIPATDTCPAPPPPPPPPPPAPERG